MKNPQSHLSNDQAQKQLRQFLISAWAIAIIAFFILGWAAVVSLIFGGRSILLSWHEGNASRPDGDKLKAASVGVVMLSLGELILVGFAG